MNTSVVMTAPNGSANYAAFYIATVVGVVAGGETGLQTFNGLPSKSWQSRTEHVVQTLTIEQFWSNRLLKMVTIVGF